MTVFALLRHGATDWNEGGRLQGRRDEPLGAAARAALAAARLPPELAGFAWLTSPLRRAVETAAALGIDGARLEPRLTEMDWGEWEGQTLAALRAIPGGAMARRESAGLDFTPPGGESPREVQRRVAPLLLAVARAGHPTGAVTHKGVIRAVLALATGWDMRGRTPVRLDWSALHLFALADDGRPALLHANLALVPR